MTRSTFVRSRVRWMTALAAVLGLLAAPTGALANGPCGQNGSGSTACQLAIPSTVSGSLVTSNESDYYVFSATAGTELFVTVTDTETPTCNDCGDVDAGLYDAQGNSLDQQTGQSSPNNGITVPRSFAYTLPATGTYYLILSGGLGRDSNNNPTPVPYTLQVSAASSPCGIGPSGSTACAVTSPATLTGKLQTSNQSDYYVFNAEKGTQLSVTVTDTETPTCNDCGDVDAGLYDAQGNSLDQQTGQSSPNNGITVPRSFAYTLPATGTYYLILSGGLGRDSNNNPTPVPYTLQVTASPNVTWPPPAPAPTPPPPAPPPPAPAPTPPAPAPTPPPSSKPTPIGSAPAAGADSTGEQFVFWQGTDGHLWETWYVGGRWNGPGTVSIAGRIASMPAVAVQPGGEEDVFWKGADANLWEGWYARGRWHATGLGGGPLGSAPSAGADRAGEQFVFWRGTDGHLWEKWYVGGRWNGPASIPIAGRIGSAPAVAAQPGGEEDVFWKGADGNLWEGWYARGRWHATGLGGGPLGSAPSAGADRAGEQFVFWRGTDGHLWEKWYVGGRWNGPASIPLAGTIASQPAVAVQPGGQEDVFWKGADANLWEAWYTRGWHGSVTALEEHRNEKSR